MTDKLPDPAAVAAKEIADAFWNMPVRRADGCEISAKRFARDIIREAYAEQTAELERLRAIVDKLPKTADGVAVTGDETLHVAYGSGLIHSFVVTGPYITSTYGIEGAYSTRETAEAAKEK